MTKKKRETCKGCHYVLFNEHRKGFGFCYALPSSVIYHGEYLGSEGKPVARNMISTVGEVILKRPACIYWKAK